MPGEWALLKKHPSEKCFGVQVRRVKQLLYWIRALPGRPFGSQTNNCSKCMVAWSLAYTVPQACGCSGLFVGVSTCKAVGTGSLLVTG